MSRLSVFIILLIAPVVVWSDCSSPDLKINSKVSTYLEEALNEKAEDEKINLVANIYCQESISKNSRVYFDADLKVVKRFGLNSVDPYVFEANLKQAYLNIIIPTENIKLIAGKYLHTTGELEVRPLMGRGYSLEIDDSLLFPQQYGAEMVYGQLQVNPRVSTAIALISAESLSFKWPESGARGSLSQLPLSKISLSDAPAVLTELTYYGSSSQVTVGYWDGPSREPKLRFNQNTNGLDEFYPSIKAIGINGEFFGANQSVRLDYSHELHNKGTIDTLAIGHITYITNLLNEYSNSSFYLEYYRELNNSTDFSGTFDNDLIIGATAELNNSELTSLDWRTMLDLSTKSIMSSIKVEHDISTNQTLIVQLNKFKIHNSDIGLSNMSNNDSLSFSLITNF